MRLAALSASVLAWYGELAMGQVRPLEHASFAELVRRPFDAVAETEVCVRFAPRIRLYGLKHLRDEDRASELVQLVLVAVIEALRAGRVTEPDHLDRFVLGTCRHVAARMRTREAKAVATEPAILEALDVRSVMPAVDAVDVGVLIDCVGKLEARAQTVLHLTFYRDKTADEIAAVMDTSAGNVRVIRHRAMTQLRDCMEAAP